MASTFTTNKQIEKPAHGSYNDDWDIPLNADMDDIDNALGGNTAINVTGVGAGSYALTLSQYQPPNIEFSGTLGAALTYYIPSGVGGQWSVFNNTSGGGSLSFGSASGSHFTCPQGQRTLLICDGANMQMAQTVVATGFANPTALVGITAVDGAATTAMRSDASPPLDTTQNYVFTGIITTGGPLVMEGAANYLESGATLNVLGQINANQPSGSIIANTQPPGDNSLNVATTAFVQAANNSTSGVGAGGNLYSNLKVSATGTNQNISITANSVTLTNGSVFFTARAITQNCSTTATGAGGLDVGSIATNTWYSLWLIYNPTTSTLSTLISLSTGSTPTSLPTGYSFYGRIGWVRTDSTGSHFPLGFIQRGNKVQYVVKSGSNVPSAVLLASSAVGTPTDPPTWGAISLANFVPTSASAVTVWIANAASGGAEIIVAPNNQYGGYNSATNPPPLALFQGTTNPANIPFEMMLESTSIYYASATGGPSVFLLGWEDNL